MTDDEIKIRRLPQGQGLDRPAYATAGAAGMELLATVDTPVTILPGGRALIPTGLALKHGIVLPNAPGTIDEDYRGYPGAR